MGRRVKDAKLDTRSARQRLAKRHEPYWRLIEPGCHLGYYKGERGGTWVARWRPHQSGAYRKSVIGPADDRTDTEADPTYLDFATAQRKAREWFAEQGKAARGDTCPYTVGQALNDYLNEYQKRSGLGYASMKYNIEAHIRPALGEILLTNLTAQRIEQWHHGLAEASARLRTGRGKKPRQRAAPQTADGLRARKATANKLLTILKAALSYAFRHGKITNDAAWRRVKPFKGVDAPRIRFLEEDEALRLVNACDSDFRPLVKAAILTGCRYGELVNMRVSDFSADAGLVFVSASKSGKPRHVVLTDEAAELFGDLCAGRAGVDPVFVRQDGEAWRKSHQIRRMREACARAKIEPPVSFHILRHCSGSWMARRGVPLPVIASHLGHSDTRMTERHYAHLSAGYIEETIRAGLPRLGFDREGKVVAIKRKAGE